MRAEDCCWPSKWPMVSAATSVTIVRVKKARNIFWCLSSLSCWMYPQTSDLSVAVISNYHFHWTIFHLTTDGVHIVSVLLSVSGFSLALVFTVVSNRLFTHLFHLFGGESLFHCRVEVTSDSFKILRHELAYDLFRRSSSPLHRCCSIGGSGKGKRNQEAKDAYPTADSA